MYKEKYKEKVYNKREKIILVNELLIFMQLKHRVFGQYENSKII